MRSPWQAAAVLGLVACFAAWKVGEGRGKAEAARPQLQTAFGKLPVYFIENQGQLDDRVAYYVQGQGLSVYFGPQEVTFAITEQKEHPQNQGSLLHRVSLAEEQDSPPQRWAVKLDFVDANPSVELIGQERTPAVISYFKGPKADWKTGLPTYSGVVYRNLWPGIDLVYNGQGNRLKHEFVVRPGARPEQIQLAYRGATEIAVNNARQLEVSTPMGSFWDDAPYAYQEVDGKRVEVRAGYALEPGQRYGFQLGTYDPSRPLVIDPVLVYAGYIGGVGDDIGNGIAVDGSGNVYVTGQTRSTQASFPVMVGPDPTFNGPLSTGSYDAFVAKVNAAGTALVYAGYIGGTDNDYSNGIAVDGSGNAYVTGSTNSTQPSFPATVGPALTYKGGAQDAFVAKVNAAGTVLLYAGFIGSAGEDDGFGIAVDTSGNAYVTGSTPDLVTPNRGWEAFVAKVNAAGTALVYIRNLGGTGFDRGLGIAVDGSGNAYVTGYTDSTQASFPVTVGPDPTHNGGIDAFVAKVNAAGTALVYAGYIGGAAADFGTDIAVDGSGNAYVAGLTDSSAASFPVTAGPDLTDNGGGDAFVAKVNAAGTALVYAGYIGGADGDLGYGIAVDGSGNAYVTGYTRSTEASFPVTAGPDLTYDGGGDAFVAKVNAAGTALVYAGYIGGVGEDYGYGIAVDGSGNAYVTGYTASTQASFPVTVGPDLTHNGGSDAFVAKIATGNQVISQVADGDGWKTAFILVNLDGSPAAFTLRFFADDGTPLPLSFDGVAGASSVMQGTIAVGGSRTIETLGIGTSLRQGWAELVTQSYVRGMAVFRQRVPGRPDQEAAVELTSSGGRFALPFDNTAGFVTAMGLLNSNASQTVSSLIAFRGEDGGSGSTTPLLLSSRSHLAFFLPAQFPAAANQRGVAELTGATRDVAALGLRFNPSGSFTSFPALPFDDPALTADSRTISQFVDGAGWKTTVILVNLDSAPAPFTLRLFRDDGTPLRMAFEGAIGLFDTFQGTIPVGGARTIPTRDLDAALSQGWAQLTTLGKIGGLAVFRQHAEGRPDQEAAVPLTPNVRRFVLPFDNTQGFVTSLALVNANAAAARTVAVVARDENGAEILTDSITVAAHAHGAFALPDRFPSLANRRGVIEFSTDTPDLSGLGLRFHPGGAFTSFPTLPR